MTLPSPVKEPKNNTKAIIIVAVIFSIVTVIALAVVAALFLSAPAIDENENVNDGAQISKEQVPSITDFELTQKEGTLEATYAFSVESISENIHLEYKIEDNMLRVLNDGTIREAGLTEGTVLLKSGTESVYLMVRATDGKEYSRWVTSGSVAINTDSSEITERAVSDAFFNTNWAQKNDTSVEGLADALGVAFNIEVFTDQYAPELQMCFWGNKTEVVAGEIVRPQPDLGDELYNLKASVYQKDATIFEITYYWCEK